MQCKSPQRNFVSKPTMAPVGSTTEALHPTSSKQWQSIRLDGRSLNCRCPFPVWCSGQDVEFDCFGSWSLPSYQFYWCFCDLWHFHSIYYPRVRIALVSLVSKRCKYTYKARSEIIETTAKLPECMDLGYQNLLRIEKKILALVSHMEIPVW